MRTLSKTIVPFFLLCFPMLKYGFDHDLSLWWEFSRMRPLRMLCKGFHSVTQTLGNNKFLALPPTRA